MAIYRGVNGVNRKIIDQFRSVNGVNKKILKTFKSASGVNKSVFSWKIKAMNLFKDGVSNGLTNAPAMAGSYKGLYKVVDGRMVFESSSNTSYGTITTNTIDLSDYTKIVIVFKSTSPTYSYMNSDLVKVRLHTSIPTTISNAETGYNVHHKEGVANVDDSCIIDISSVTGKHYLSLVASARKVATFYIKEFYLE